MEIPYEVTPRRDTGLFNSKLGIWLFLASEVMLFGGLFSAYVFLRVGVIDGVDSPWPWGINVHKTFVVIGFVNTLVLIISSVFVVFAWLAVKERKWKKFQFFMYLTVACAGLFMVLKTIEYNSKLTQHHDIKLTDNSVMEGTILDRSFDVPFDAKSVEFTLGGSIPGFVKDVKGDFPKLKAEWTYYEKVEGVRTPKTATAEINSASEFNRWFVKTRNEVTREIVEERKRYRSEITAKEKAQYAGETFKNPLGPDVITKAKVTAEEPFHLHSRRRQVRPIERSKDGGDDTMTYLDGCTVIGKGGDDRIKFEPHYVDMQLVPIHQQKDSMVWDVLDDDYLKKAWYKNRDAAYEEMEHYYSSRNREIPENMLRGYYINLQSLHDKEHAPPFMTQFFKDFKHAATFGGGDHGDDHKDDHDHGHDHSEDHSHADDHGKDDAHGHDDHGDHKVVMIPRDKIKFFNSHGPRNNNYFALYFTMTALHGLHVIAGALVLLYFVVFGKKMFLRNPEHLANRVEVGGLFWHFVDLIWIFLFPLMYLL